MAREKPPLETRRMNDERFTHPVDGRDQLYGLDDLCKKYLKPESVVLELGSFNGVSTRLFSHYAQMVVAVDENCSSSLKKIAQENKNIITLRGSTFAVLPTLMDSFYDLIYIDADHSYNSVVIDIALSVSKLKPDGVLCGHDYCTVHHPPVVQAITYFQNNGVLQNLEVYSDTSWSAKVNSDLIVGLDSRDNTVLISKKKIGE